MNLPSNRTHRFLFSCFIVSCCLVGRLAHAQTASTYISQGRAFLAARDLTNANTAFVAALRLSPSHSTGNVFHAATRLLTLGNQPAGKALLDRLGFAPLGRYEYDWVSTPPRDTNGQIVLPSQVSAEELSFFLRTNVLKEISAAASNLAKVTSTSFKLNLTSNETTTTALTVDYGDILMARSLLELAKYACYTAHSWDADAQLTAFRNLFNGGETTMEQFLNEHPKLLTFHHTNELTAARQSLTNAIKLYFSASDFIWKRSTGSVRLFNYDPDTKEDETRVRTILTNLNKSITAAVPIPYDTNLVIDLRHHFDGLADPRSFLPDFAGNEIICGTWPDLTWHGLLQGLSRPQLETWIDSMLDLYEPSLLRFGFRLDPPLRLSSDKISLEFRCLDHHVYTLQISSDLIDWFDVSWGIPNNGDLAFSTFSPHPDFPDSAYYRVVDITAAEPLTAQVRDILTGAPLQGEVEIYRDGLFDYSFPTEDDGRFIIIRDTGFWNRNVQVTAAGYDPVAVHSWLDTGKVYPIYVVPTSLRHANDDFEDRLTLTGTNISTTGFNVGATTSPYEPGNQCVWWEWTAPKSGAVTIDASGSSFDTVARVYTGSTMGALTLWAWDDDGGSELTSKVEFFVSAGVTYSIAVHSYGSETGRILLSLKYTTPTPPSFIYSPESSRAFTGQSIWLESKVAGTLPMAFQWRKNGVAIQGQTNIHLQISNAQVSHSGTYTLLASNALGSAVSASATVTVTASAPRILSQPQSRQVPVGGYASFEVSAEGSEPISCQWRRNGVNLPGETDHYLTIWPVQYEDAGSYTAVLRNSLGTVTTLPAVLTVY